MTIVGSGIQFGAHTTPQAQAAVQAAAEVWFLMGEPLGGDWIRGLHPNAHDLGDIYAAEIEQGAARSTIYQAMADRVMGRVREGVDVCVVLYGHPGVFATPARLAIDAARAEGIPVRVWPGISAEDCLFVDLGIDPGTEGCQSYEAADFLIRPRRFDPTVPLVLWQIGALGNHYGVTSPPTERSLGLLVDCLEKDYPSDHQVILYRASEYVALDPIIRRVHLADLPQEEIGPLVTLFVPPRADPEVDEAMAEQLAGVAKRENERSNQREYANPD